MTLVGIIHHQREGKWAVQYVLIADATTSHSFFFLSRFRAVGDFRAEFRNKPIARTSRPFGMILRLLIHRAVCPRRCFKRHKRSKSHGAMGVQSLGPRGETPFFSQRFRAIRLLPDTMPTGTGITYKILSREDPKKKYRRGRFLS